MSDNPEVVKDNIFFQYMSNITTNKSLAIFIFFLFIFSLIGIFTWIYYYYLKPKLEKKYAPNKEFIEAEPNKKESAELYFFFTNWCPYCKTALPIWEEVKTKVGDSTFGKNNNVFIKFIDVDCENQADLAEKFNVTGYPTIKLIYNKETYEYDAKPNTDNIIKFLNEVI